MADKSFGVKELNLLNASGTPTVTSPNNLNLNANTVAISTSATVGNNLTVSGQINVGSNIKIGNAGVVTATSFVGSGSGLTGVASTDPSNVQATWKLGGGSGSGFTFTGPGQDGSEGNPDIYLVRGQRYLFDNTTLAGNHPFEFRNAANNADYTDGVSGAQNGLQYLNVQHDAPARLKYRCTIHTGSMLGDIYIIGGPEVISGVVTATTFVGNLTGNVTGTASANAVLTGSTNNQLVTVTGANAITGESNLTFDGTQLSVTGSGTDVLKIESTDAGAQGVNLILQHSPGATNMADNDVISLIQFNGKDDSNNNTTYSSIRAVATDVSNNSESGDITFHTRNAGAFDEKLRILSSGNIGIGTDNPQYLDAGFRELTISGGSEGAGLHLQDGNANVVGGFFTSDNTNAMIIRTRSNHPMIFRTNNTERFRITANGSVGVGDYGSTNLTHAFQALRTSGSTYVSSKNTGGNAIFYAEASNGNTAKLELMQAGTGNFTLEVGSDNALMIKDDGGERLRINSSGTLFMGKTSQSSGTAGVELYADGPNFMTRNGTTVLGLNNDAGTNGDIMRFYFQDVHKGSLNFSSGSFSATTASDYRLKENDTPITDGIARVKKLKPIRFNFKENPSETLDGFFAHELQEVVPDCVTGEKDGEISERGEGYQCISKEGLVPLLTAALKEEIAKREALEARIAALEGS